MTWVIRTGIPKDPRDKPHYLSTWNPTLPTSHDDYMSWHDDQRFAFRFDDRNLAVKVALMFPICAYDDEVTVVKLGPKPTVNLDAELELRRRWSATGWREGVEACIRACESSCEMHPDANCVKELRALLPSSTEQK